jgi:acetylornithine deacetylase/succinyl-diaminopimelate desuccinylase-like protein
VVYPGLRGEESLLSRSVTESELVQSLFSFQRENQSAIIEEWIKLTQIPSPSGHEEKRARYIQAQFRKAGLDKVYTDEAGNVVGVWKGTEKGKKIVFSAHMDTVFQGVWDIEVKKEGNVLKAPGIGDDTASLININ